MEESLVFLMKKRPDLDCFFIRNEADKRPGNLIQHNRNLTLSRGFWAWKNKEVLRKFCPDLWIGNLNFPAISKLPFGIWLPGPPIPADAIKWSKRNERLLSAAAIIFTDAAYLRNALLERFSVGENKVILLNKTADPIFLPLTSQEREQVKTQYGGNKEYFIITQDLRREEDLIKLLKSFSFFKKKLQSNMGLVITSWNKQTIRKSSEKIQTFKYSKDLHMIDELSESQSARLVAGAYGFLEPYHQPSVRRILNAFQCHVPVICGNREVISEIDSQAILYADPQDPEALGQQLVLLYKNEKLRNEMVKRGLALLEQYNRDKNAEQLWFGIQQGIGPR